MHQYVPVSLVLRGLIWSVVVYAFIIAGCGAMIKVLVLFLVYTGPCGPIHTMSTITGVSTTDGIVKTHCMLVRVPE